MMTKPIEPYVESYKKPERNNVDLLIDKVLDDTTDDKRISAIAEVIGALGGQQDENPNTVGKPDKNDESFGLDQPFDFSEVEGVEIQGVGKKEVSILRTPEH